MNPTQPKDSTYNPKNLEKTKETQKNKRFFQKSSFSLMGMKQNLHSIVTLGWWVNPVGFGLFWVFNPKKPILFSFNNPSWKPPMFLILTQPNLIRKLVELQGLDPKKPKKIKPSQVNPNSTRYGAFLILQSLVMPILTAVSQEFDFADLFPTPKL